MPAVMESTRRGFAQGEEVCAPSDSLSPEWEAELAKRLKEVEDGTVELVPFDESLRTAILRIASMLVADRKDATIVRNGAVSKPRRVSMYGALKGKVKMTADFDEPIEDLLKCAAFKQRRTVSCQQ